jgi:hypothetical protein
LYYKTRHLWPPPFLFSLLSFSWVTRAADHYLSDY